MKLFLLPYAGGSSLVYKQLQECISNTINPIPFEYKGRGARSNEKFYESIHDGVDDALCFIKSHLEENEDYAIFGHSMGGLFTYELLGRIEQEKMNYPIHVFLSSRRAPHLKRPEHKKYYLLPNQEFWEELVRIGGIDSQLIENEDIREYFIPIIRSDYKLVEEYENQNMDIRINCNLTICYATNDLEVDQEQVLKWQQYAKKDIEIFEFEGGHFYFRNDPTVLGNIINNTLFRYRKNKEHQA